MAAFLHGGQPRDLQARDLVNTGMQESVRSTLPPGAPFTTDGENSKIVAARKGELAGHPHQLLKTSALQFPPGGTMVLFALHPQSGESFARDVTMATMSLDKGRFIATVCSRHWGLWYLRSMLT